MTSQPPEPSLSRTSARPAGNGHGDQAAQAILLRRQVAELERRIEAITQSERKARVDLLDALASSKAATTEQARLHEELAARERVVAEIVSREGYRQSQLSEPQRRIHDTGDGPASAMIDLAANSLSAAEAALAEARALTSELASHVDQRARILGFIAIEMRGERHRLAALRARLDADVFTMRTSGRATTEAALAARHATRTANQKFRAERWQNWAMSTVPPRGAPRRRNRPAQLMEKILSRLGPLGIAAALNGSGLWNNAYQVDNSPSSRRATLLGYAGAHPNPDATLKALFDQRFYLAANPAVAGSRQPPLAHYLIHGDRENRSPHPLVDAAWYRANNPHELGSTGLTVLQHFLFLGSAKGLNPHPLFDVKYYTGQLSDPADQAMNPLVHYLRTGWRRGFNPHPLFDNDFYLTRYPDVADLMIPPLLHYVTTGAREGRDTHPLFFSHWYQAAYPDVLGSGQLPLAHFLEKGLSERRNPNPFFNSDIYLRAAPEAHTAGVDPLQHYIETGAWKGLSPIPEFDAFAFLAAHPAALTSAATPLEAWIDAGRPHATPLAGAAAIDASPHRATLLLVFDAAYYTQQAGDLLGPADDPLDHYLSTGWRLGFNPHRLFDTAWYADRYPEALASGLPPLLHFITEGAAKLHDTHPLFDSRWYAERYPDVATGGEIPLVHYIHFGAKEGRSPGPLFDACAYLNAYPDVHGLDALQHFLTRWPFDNRPDSFASMAAGCPQGMDAADWVAALADSIAQRASAWDRI